ncbi:P-type ATPase of unknown pump specificity [Oesophagostomum dentatum]|uniref:Helicase ATP-binding domain-containing protein n=1 Tax=Oesophagostomum dentatum TaxID=61180 RepID=A0A0B1TGA7_OESDE|nr:P-type ATPase of unknown pump specificity [Oesophagostomum dentatum]
MKFYQQSRGVESDEQLEEIKYLFGDNRTEMVIPQFWDLFKERATAPFFVFQVFCVGLWCLEDMWYYSLFTLFMLMTFEATLVKAQLKNMQEIRNMGNKPFMIQVYRNHKWAKIKTDELVSGDIVSLGRSSDDQVVPCDMILLRGPCIVDESMLTGESVPQMKEPIEDLEKDRYFDIEVDSRLHIVFGGTKIVQHTPPGKGVEGLKGPDNGCICYVLRTGFNTSQGKLLRTIMFGVKRVTANNLETFCFILFLLIFAIAAAAYLWVVGSQDEKRNKYKLFLECTLILTSVLACCHSLVRFDDDLVGDPLEKACLTWCDWSLTKGDAVLPPKGSKLSGLKIFHRYHFSSAMKRMTVVAGYQLPGFQEPKMIVAVKGAPETLRSMYENVPKDYDEIFTNLTRQGARVLAMGIKELQETRLGELRDTKREVLEKNLRFAGFVVISCPLKPDTKVMIKEIIDSSHKVVMVTGDNPLTACNVAKVLKFIRKKVPTLVLDEPVDKNAAWKWKAVDESVEYDAVPFEDKKQLKQFFLDNEFCLTGPAFAYLLDSNHDFLRKLIGHVRVFARMAPKQKERVINEYKSLGYITLMCGDGTNDVGALKHSNVGVALLSHPYDATKAEQKEKEKKEKIEEARRLMHLNNPTPPGIPSNAGRRGDAPVGARTRPTHPSVAHAHNRLEKLMKELEEEERATITRLGDASIAAPFTSKYTSIASICHVIKQGRCTLVTTLQMFKILALNALVSAYSLSALYMDGVKFSDTQATIQGLFLAACFLFVSRSKPLKTLSKQRPMSNIFNAYTLLTVTGQFIVHFGCLLYVVNSAHAAYPRTEPVDLEAKFTPNILNTSVYIISMALQVCTFAVNYRGRPFMESLLENKAMLYSILISGGSVFMLAVGASADAMQQFELVVLPLDELLDAADRVLRSVCIDTLTSTAGDYSIIDTFDLNPENVKIDPLSLLKDLIQPSEPATWLSPAVDSHGKISDVVEYIRADDEFGAASVSMSLNRSPAMDSTSIRGSSSNVPFYPGGFDSAFGNVMAFAKEEDNQTSDEKEFFRENDLLTCAPGMPRGLSFSLPVEDHSEEKMMPEKGSSLADGQIDLDSTDLFELMDFVGGGAPLVVPMADTSNEVKAIDESKETEASNEAEASPVVEEIEVVETFYKLVAFDLKVFGKMHVLLKAALENPLPKPTVKFAPPSRFAYAKELNPELCQGEYKSLLPNMAKKYPFELDGFQQAAVVCMEKGESVFVAAHTSAGKTVVAEYAVALCEKNRTRAIYTSPIKALSNQKFRDFKMMFTDVGLVTGDIQLFPDAFCLIMTTEILRSMLYNGSEVIRDLEWVVFDEVHYINNAERGHVWEEVLIMLPSHVKIVMLSATVPNCIEFADWVGRIKNRKINVVSTLKRPVPLEHYLYTGQDGKTKKDLFKVVDMNGTWLEIGYKKASEAKVSKNLSKVTVVIRGGTAAGRGGTAAGRGGTAAGDANRGRGAQNRGGGGGGTYNARPNNRNDKNVFINLIDFLRTNEQLPMVVFVFSRKRSALFQTLFLSSSYNYECDDNAQLLQSVDLTTEVEKSHIRSFFSECIDRLKGSDKKLPQAEKELSTLPKTNCQMCEPPEVTVGPIRQFHDVLVNFVEKRAELWLRLAAVPVMDKRLKCGRVLLVSSAQHRLQNQLVLLIKDFLGDGKRSFQVLVPCYDSESLPDEQKRKSDEFARLPKEERDWEEETCMLEGCTRFGIEAVAPLASDGGQRSFRMVNDLPISSLLGVGKKAIKIDVAEVLSEARSREIPRLRYISLFFVILSINL